MSETYTLPTRSLRLRGALGFAFAVAGFAVLFTGVSGVGSKAAQTVGVGALLLLLAVVILAPLAAGPVVKALGAPIRKIFGTVGILSSTNASRNPRRTAATASALMIGLALITTVSVLASSVKKSVGTLVSQGTGASFILLGSGSQALPNTLSDDLNGKPGIQAASGIALVPIRIKGVKAVATATDPSAIKDNILLTPQAGDLNSLSPTTLLISKKVSDERHWKVGTQLPLTFSEGGQTSLRVSGIYKENQLAGEYLIDRAVAARYVTNLADIVGLVRATPTANLEQVRTSIEGVLQQYPGIKVQSRGGIHPERPGQHRAAGEPHLRAAGAVGPHRLLRNRQHACPLRH